MLLSARSPSEKASYCVTFWKRQNDGDRRNTSGCLGSGRRRDNTQNADYATTVMDTCHDAFFKTHRTYDTKSEPSWKPQTLDNDDGQCQFMLG